MFCSSDMFHTVDVVLCWCLPQLRSWYKTLDAIAWFCEKAGQLLGLCHGSRGKIPSSILHTASDQKHWCWGRSGIPANS